MDRPSFKISGTCLPNRADAFRPITALVLKCFGSAQPIRALVR